MAKQERLDDFQNQLLDLMKKDIVEFPFTLFGITYYSLDAAKADMALEFHYYDTAIENENYLYQALQNDKLTEEQIEKIITEKKYVKEEVE